MDRPDEPPGESQEIRCPRLGHEISFSYCRRENRGLPCYKVVDCWFPYFKIEDYLAQELSARELQELFSPPQKDKVLSLLEQIKTLRSQS